MAIPSPEEWGFTPFFLDGFSKQEKKQAISFRFGNKVVSLFPEMKSSEIPAFAQKDNDLSGVPAKSLLCSGHLQL